MIDHLKNVKLILALKMRNKFVLGKICRWQQFYLMKNAKNVIQIWSQMNVKLFLFIKRELRLLKNF